MLRAVRFAAGMTLGFVAVFGRAGLAFSTLALSIELYLPVVTVVIGIILGRAGCLVARRYGPRHGHGHRRARTGAGCRCRPNLFRPCDAPGRAAISRGSGLLLGGLLLLALAVSALLV